MAFCTKCGSMIDDGETLCPSCKNSAASEASGNGDFVEKIKDLNNTEDTTSQYDKKDVDDNKLMGILSYFSWLVIIPILAAPQSKFARYHANQGLILAILEIIWWVASGIITAIFGLIHWRLASIVGIFCGIVNLAFLALAIIGIVNVANGKAKELPLIGKFKILS